MEDRYDNGEIKSLFDYQKLLNDNGMRYAKCITVKDSNMFEKAIEFKYAESESNLVK